MMGRQEEAQSLFAFFVNGTKVVDATVHPEWTLLRYLRRNLYLTGTKEGCSEGGCGACTVMVSKYDKTSETINHFTVNACLTLLVSLHGTAVTTVEGIGSIRTGLHPVQERLAKAHGSQCGFCTPGFVMSMYTLLRNSPQPSMQEIERNLCGNLCRCTGYRPIIEGFRTFCPASAEGCCPKEGCCLLKDEKEDEDLVGTEVLFNPEMFKRYDPSQEIIFPPELKLFSSDEMELSFRGPGVKFFRPVELGRAVYLKSVHPGACLVAGNTEVRIQEKYLNKHYPIKIDLSHVVELKMINFQDTYIDIGASLTLSEVEKVLKSLIEKLPGEKSGVLVSIIDALQRFGSQQIRNIATLGGNIMNGSPISDLIPILMASNSSLLLASLDGERRVRMDDFFTGYKTNISRPTEILASVRLPFTEKDEYMKYYKQSRRRDDDLAIVNAAFRVKFREESDVVSAIWLSYGGMAEMTVMPKATMKALVGLTWSDELLDIAVNSLISEMPLHPDAPGGMIEYRKSLSISFFFKFYQDIKLELIKISSHLSPIEEDATTAERDVRTQSSQSLQFFQKVPADQEPIDPIGRPIASVSCLKQATGEAEYIDDIPSFENELHAAYVTSKRPKAKILGIDASPALKIDGVKGFFSAKDVTVDRKYNVFAHSEVECVGQILGMVVASCPKAAHTAASKVVVQYEDLPDPIMTFQDAIQLSSYFSTTDLKRGNIEEGFGASSFVIEGEFQVGGQEHFYLEPQVHMVIPRDEELEIFSCTHGLNNLQSKVAEVFKIPQNKVVCKVKRLGGSFGGKERVNAFVLPLVCAARRTNCPVRLVMDRREDMLMTGGRHPLLAKWKVGFLQDGRIKALQIKIYLNAGWNSEVSNTVLMTATDKIDGPYKFENCDVRGFSCRTNMPSNTAFRGFGGPQITVVLDDMMSKVANFLSMDEKQVKEINLNGHFENAEGVLGPSDKYCHLIRCWNEVLERSSYESRREDNEAFNRRIRYRKRGLGIVPVMFGIGFEVDFLNQAAALILVYTDGSVLLTHGGVEMGQGLHTKMIQVVSREFQIAIDAISIAETSTDKIPNASPTAASSAADIYGMAVLEACGKILKKLEVYKQRKPEATWNQWVEDAYYDRVSLMASGSFATPGICESNEELLQGNNNFQYFSFGVAVSEVEVDCLTGDHVVLRSDIVMDVGKSLNPAIDVGQIEGGFVQGMGLYTMEEILFNSEGQLLTSGPGTYKIPSISDIPKIFNVFFLRDSPNARAIYSSKSVGEPPLLLAASVFSAIREAVKAYRSDSGLETDQSFNFDSPATVERIRMACCDFITKKAKSSSC